MEAVPARQMVPVVSGGGEHGVARPRASPPADGVIDHTTRATRLRVDVQAYGARRRAVRWRIAAKGGAAVAGDKEAVESVYIDGPGGANVTAVAHGWLALICKWSRRSAGSGMASVTLHPPDEDLSSRKLYVCKGAKANAGDGIASNDVLKEAW